MHIQYNTQFYESNTKYNTETNHILEPTRRNWVQFWRRKVTIVTKHNLIFSVSNTNQLRQELGVMCIVITDITIKRWEKAKITTINFAREKSSNCHLKCGHKDREFYQ